jgi:hypothetical protein
MRILIWDESFRRANLNDPGESKNIVIDEAFWQNRPHD